MGYDHPSMWYETSPPVSKLYTLIRDNRLVTLKELLSTKEINLEEPILETCTTKPLHEAVSLNRREMVRLLLLYGANVNCVDLYRMTPLAKAASLGKNDIIELLIEAGADPFMKDETGRTPRERAIYYTHNDTAKILEDYEKKYQMNKSK